MARNKKHRGIRHSRTAKTGVAVAQARLLDGMHQIWLAGLGAVARAQRGAPRLLDELVAEGAKVHAKARGSARKAVRGAMHEAQAAMNERIDEMRGRAEDAYGNLEKMFQKRVHRALNQLGVPSEEEVAALSKRVDTLNANIAKLGRAKLARAKLARAKLARAKVARARRVAQRHPRRRVMPEPKAAPAAVV